MSFDSGDFTDLFGVAIAGSIALGTLGIAKEMVQGSTNPKKRKSKKKSNNSNDFELFGDLKI